MRRKYYAGLVPGRSQSHYGKCARWRVPIEFFFFALTLLGVAIFHCRNFEVALTGLIVIETYQLLFMNLDLSAHLLHE